MASINSTMLALDTKLPEFGLLDAFGKSYISSELLTDKGLLVAFWCNHCPYVKHLKPHFASLVRDYMAKGMGVVAINSNDASLYSEDGAEGMKADIESFSYGFPYLIDDTQSVAKVFEAVCTPEFYIFSGDGLLKYRGRFDASTPRNEEPITAVDISQALDAVLAGEDVNQTQQPSVGCSIKWKD